MVVDAHSGTAGRVLLDQVTLAPDLQVLVAVSVHRTDPADLAVAEVFAVEVIKVAVVIVVAAEADFQNTLTYLNS